MEPGDPPVTEEDIKKLEEQEKQEKEEGTAGLSVILFPSSIFNIYNH